jgi:hypothetical protein
MRRWLIAIVALLFLLAQPAQAQGGLSLVLPDGRELTKDDDFAVGEMDGYTVYWLDANQVGLLDVYVGQEIIIREGRNRQTARIDMQVHMAATCRDFAPAFLDSMSELVDVVFMLSYTTPDVCVLSFPLVRLNRGASL